MKEINQMRDSAAHRLTSVLAGERLLNAFRMSETQMRQYLESMRRSKIRHMMAYVDCAAQLARFALENHIPVRPLESVMACGGTLTAESRSLIQSAFGCRVHNKYGSRDCTDMACECDRGRMHTYANHALLEVVDGHGRAAGPGRLGRILVTLLHSHSFPLIRYEIGDVGALGEGSCGCGSPLPILDRVEGRSNEFLKTRSGAYVSPLFIVHLVGVVHNPGFVRRFQFVQQTMSEFVLQLEVAGDPPESVFRSIAGKLERDLRAVLGAGCTLNINRVSRIPESASGKFQSVLSNVC
jgi:phenylacetate-CoA ligase